MRLSIHEENYLLQRKREIQRDIWDLSHRRQGPRYHDMNERRVELIDELTAVENELRFARVE